MPVQTLLLISIIVFALVLVANALYAIVVKKASVLEPIILFFFFYALFVVPFPLRAYMTTTIEEDVTEHLTALLPYIPTSVFLSALALPFFTYAYYSGLARHIGARLARPMIGGSFRIAFVMLSCVSVFLLVLLTHSVGGVIDLILLGYNSSAEIFGKGYLAVGFPWLSVASLFLLCRYGKTRKFLDLCIFGCALLLIVTMNLIMGNRSQLMFLGLAVIVFWHKAIRPVSFKNLAAVGIVSFLALNLIGVVRGSNYESFSDFWAKITEPARPSLDDSHSLFYTVTTGEFVVPFETFPQMIKSVGQDVPLQFGLTYLKAPLFFIPSVFFADRPDTLTHWYMLKFYGDTYGLNEGRAFFFLSEGYLNFGPVGVILTMLAWGLALGAAHCYGQGASGQTGPILLYSLALAFIFRGIAGDFVSVFVGLPEQALSAALLGIWITNFAGGNVVPRSSLGVAKQGNPPV
jgi:hypothetical protein